MGQDPAVRFVTAKSGRQHDLLQPRLGQKEPAVRFVTAKSGPEKATKTRQYDLLRPRVGQKEPPRSGSTICYVQEWARKTTKTRYDLLRPGVSQKKPPKPRVGQKESQNPVVRFVTAKSGRQYDLLRPRVGQKETAARFVAGGPERATKTRQHDLLRPRVGQKQAPRPGSTIWQSICYGEEWARKSHQDPAVRFVAAKSGPERATKTQQYDLLRPRMGLKEPPRPGSTICYGQEWARKSHQEPGSTICYGQECARKSHQDPAVRFVNPAVRFVAAKSGPEKATKTRQYDLLRPRVGQKEPPRPGSTICYGQNGPPRPGNTICYGQEWARKSHQDPAGRFVTVKSGLERATKTRQYDLLQPRAGQKEPPRPGSTLYYGQE